MGRDVQHLLFYLMWDI